MPPSGNIINLHKMPNNASFGIVVKNANTEISQPLYTSKIQFAKGNTASFEIKPNEIIIPENANKGECCFDTIISYISFRFKVNVCPYK